jgi:YjbE family integral membrane protein
VWIGIKLIAEEDSEGDGHEIKASNRLLAAVQTVIIADIVMSIDNVLGVAAAARGSLVLLVFGLVVSIPLVIAGAQLVMKVIERFSVLIVAGGGLLGLIAGELAVDDTAVASWIELRASWLHWAAPIGGIALVVGPAKWLDARRRGRAR